MSENVKLSAFFVQLLATCSIGYLTSLIGYVFAWPSFTTAILQNVTTTPLDEPVTNSQINLLGSLTNIGALIATPFCGIIIEKLGRKYAAMVFGLPFVLAWAIISVTKNINLVLFAIFFAGFGAAGQVVSSVYITDIVQDSIRGGLTIATVAGYYCGVLISYILGGYFDYHQVVYIHFALSIVYVVSLIFLKESPVHLIQNGRDEDAAKSIAFYRRVSPKSEEVKTEIRKIKRLLDPRIEEILQTGEDASKMLPEKSEDIEVQHVSAWKFLLNSPSSKRALFACLLVMTLTICMGTIVLQVYAESILKKAVPSMSANICSIFLAIVFIVSSLISAVLTDRYGRKVLTTWSAIASGISTLLFGLQIHINFAPPWFTVFALFFYCFVFNLGATTSMVLPAEVFLPEVKSLGNSITLGCMWLMNFVILYIFNPITEAIGLGPVFYLFSVICFTFAVYCHLFLPETKGLPVDEIQLLFYKRKRIPAD